MIATQFMKDEYPTGKSDLMTAFMVRAQALSAPRGVWAMINLPSWMSLKSFEDLRRELLRDQRIVSMVHLGRGVFGSDFGTVAFVVDNARPGRARGVYRRLFEQHVDVRSVAVIEALFRDSTYNRYEVSQVDFAAIPGSPIVYWLSEKLRRVFAVCDSIGGRFDAIAGISTGDNGRFFRYWHEVSAARIGGGSEGAPWAPHHKGGASRKWAGNVEHVLRYAESSVQQMKLLPGFRHDGNADYFKPHVGWSALTSGPPSFRAIPVGCTFGSGSKALMISGNVAMAEIAVLNLDPPTFIRG